MSKTPKTTDQEYVPKKQMSFNYYIPTQNDFKSLKQLAFSRVVYFCLMNFFCQKRSMAYVGVVLTKTIS